MTLPVTASNEYVYKFQVPLFPNKYYVGDTIQYVINITNLDTQLTNYLALVEDICPDNSTMTLATNLIQAPGEGVIYTYNYTVEEADLQYITGRWRVANTIHVVGNDTLGGIINDYNSAVSIILRPKISIEKTVDFDGNGVYGDRETNAPNQTASWKIVVCNTGYDPVYNITVTDTNGHNFGAPFNLLATGACQTFTYSMTINADTVNNATAVGEDELGNTVGPVSDDAEARVSTPPVGGTAFPVNKLGLVGPWVLLVGCAAAVTLLALRKRRQA